MNDPNLSSFIWFVADLLRGDYNQSEYGKVILLFTVLRRLDCVLEATKPAVLKELEKREEPPEGSATLRPRSSNRSRTGRFAGVVRRLQLR